MKQDIILEYELMCKEHNIPFKVESSVSPYDETTLFCPSGMQQFKDKFKNINYKSTITNVQSCIRLNDINEIGDGSHLLYFDMIGFFSFREKSVKETIDFWLEYLNRINIIPDYVTIHPDKMDEWSKFYTNIEIREDIECTWSDGDINGYCTEFYKDGIEIGNIVNPLGTSIDVGFGKNRLELVLGGYNPTREEILKETVFKIIESGYKPSNVKQGYVLRKLLRICQKDNIFIDHEFYNDEIKRQDKILEKYNRLKSKYSNKSKEWWWDTMGVDLDLI